MNITKINNKIYKYEGLWQKENDDVTDYGGIPLQVPKHNKSQWQNQPAFMEKLKLTHQKLKDNKYKKHKQNKSCLICHKKDVSQGVYKLNAIRWDDSLLHYITEHNLKPSDEFIDIIFKYQLDPRHVYLKRSKTIKGKTIKKNNKVYLKLDRNQILIMDALMEYGGKKDYIDKGKTNDKRRVSFRYSEHAGLLDFDDFGLEKIIVSGNTTVTDENDDEIFLPENMVDAFDYEYIFHTHPPTPTPGYRARYGILYEFPSISDMFHFMDHYNEGKVQGSIVIAPEGMYIIRKLKYDNEKLKIDENKFYEDTSKAHRKIQDKAIIKYGVRPNKDKFYSKISQDTSYIKMLNNVLNKHQLHVDYYPRIKDEKGKWIIDTIYLPVYVVELNK